MLDWSEALHGVWWCTNYCARGSTCAWRQEQLRHVTTTHCKESGPGALGTDRQVLSLVVHLFRFRLTTPDWLDRHLLWKETIDWSDLFVIHVMGHLDFTEYTPENIRALNSTFGAAMRYIYYGSPKSSWFYLTWKCTAVASQDHVNEAVNGKEHRRVFSRHEGLDRSWS